MYSGEMNRENIERLFAGAADFIIRELRCGDFTLYAYAIDRKSVV